ncbi:MAG: ribosome biogenesis GTPase Der [Dehalococcoidia bacterium]
MALPIVAIVGRPNVGKSTLFNRLAGRRIAIVSDIPGTTRDRVSVDASWNDRRFMLLDTGGIEDRPGTLLWEDVRQQTEQALKQADGVILVVDVTEGLTPSDEDAADMVRRSNKPAVIAANKADNLAREYASADFYALGVGASVPVSAYHDSGISDLMEQLFEVMPAERFHARETRSVRIAIAGRPNVGKSALFNALTGEERAIVSPVPGTTRDTLDSRFIYEGRDLTFLDTAGLRRRGKTEQGIEKFSALRTIQAIERSFVVLIVMDATEFVTAQDTHISGYVDEAERAAVIVVNKWDLAGEAGLTKQAAETEIRERFKFLPDVPILFTSAVTGAGVDQIPPKVLEVYDQFTRRVLKADLSRVLSEALGANPLPGHGRVRARIYNIRQERVAPPTFVFHTSHPELIHFSYRRYLENRLRDAFGFTGSPLRLQFRSRSSSK